MLKRDLSYELFSREPENWAEWAGFARDHHMAKREPSPGGLSPPPRAPDSGKTRRPGTKREPSPGGTVSLRPPLGPVESGKTRRPGTKREPSPGGLSPPPRTPDSGKTKRPGSKREPVWCPLPLPTVGKVRSGKCET